MSNGQQCARCGGASLLEIGPGDRRCGGCGAVVDDRGLLARLLRPQAVPAPLPNLEASGGAGLAPKQVQAGALLMGLAGVIILAGTAVVFIVADEGSASAVDAPLHLQEALAPDAPEQASLLEFHDARLVLEGPSARGDLRFRGALTHMLPYEVDGLRLVVTAYGDGERTGERALLATMTYATHALPSGSFRDFDIPVWRQQDGEITSWGYQLFFSLPPDGPRGSRSRDRSQTVHVEASPLPEAMVAPSAPRPIAPPARLEPDGVIVHP